MRVRQAVGSLLGVSLVLALTAIARADGPLPRLEGPAFAGPTHLHLIVAGAPPAIVDVDSGAVRLVPGVTTSPYSQIRLVPVTGGALAIVHQACDPCATPIIKYATNGVGFRIGLDGSVERLGSGWSFLPARDPSVVWVLSRDANRRCSLRLVPSPRPSMHVPCGLLQEDGEDGMLMSTPAGEVFLNTRTGRMRPASGGGRVLQSRDLAFRDEGDSMLAEQALYLDDLARGTSRRMPWPSILNWYGGWAQQPHGRLIALEFADPGYPGQAEDFWIFDPATHRLQHLPGFPAQVKVKFSSWRWLDDGRLALLLQGGGRIVVALWTPGSKTLPLVPVEQLLERTNGSFVPVVA
jgi:hypothetical protein